MRCQVERKSAPPLNSDKICSEFGEGDLLNIWDRDLGQMANLFKLQNKLISFSKNF